MSITVAELFAEGLCWRSWGAQTLYKTTAKELGSLNRIAHLRPAAEHLRPHCFPLLWAIAVLGRSRSLRRSPARTPHRKSREGLPTLPFSGNHLWCTIRKLSGLVRDCKFCHLSGGRSAKCCNIRVVSSTPVSGSVHLDATVS